MIPRRFQDAPFAGHRNRVWCAIGPCLAKIGIRLEHLRNRIQIGIVVTRTTVDTDTVVRIREAAVTFLDEVLLVLVLHGEVALRVLETVVGIKRRKVGVGLVVDREIVRVACDY